MIVAPSGPEGSGFPSKTNVFDESISLSSAMAFLNPVLEALKHYRSGEASLFNFNCTMLISNIRQAAVMCRLDHLALNLYGNRHGGASHLRLTGTPLLEIKKRGRWVTDQSLRRYEKATAAQQMLNKIPIDVQKFGALAEQCMLRVIPYIVNYIRSSDPHSLVLIRNLMPTVPAPHV